MKYLFTSFLILFAVALFAQDTTEALETPNPVSLADTVDKESPFILQTGAGLFSRYFWRGVKFGSGVSIQGYADLSLVNENGNGAFGIGAFAAQNFMGSFLDFGNTMNLYLYYSQNIGDNSNVTFYLDDYFFYNEDNLYSAFDYSPENTLHFIETRIEATIGKWHGVAGYSIYQAESMKNTAPYLELGYSINDETRIFAGGVTGASDLNFMTNSGITNVGVTQSRNIYRLPCEFTFVCNPSYKKISEISLARPATASAFTFIAAIAF